MLMLMSRLGFDSTLLGRPDGVQACAVPRGLAARSVPPVQRGAPGVHRSGVSAKLRLPLHFQANSATHLALPPTNANGRFAETEAVAALTLLVSQYRIEVKAEPQFAGETFEQRKARVLRTNVRFTT